jgi:hypothetical protein
MSLPAVGLNALFLDPGVSGGSETYLRSLVQAIAREAPGACFELMTTRRGAAALVGEAWPASVHVLGFRCDDTEPIRRTLMEQVATRRVAKRRDRQLLHSPGNRGPCVRGPVGRAPARRHVFLPLDGRHRERTRYAARGPGGRIRRGSRDLGERSGKR